MPVLAGASGATFAFGLGHLDGTAAPGSPGHSVVAGHRDTSLTLLGNLQPDDPISCSGPGRILARLPGDRHRHRRCPAALTHTGPCQEKTSLTLVTCWPLDAIVPGGPLRYLVFAGQTPSR